MKRHLLSVALLALALSVHAGEPVIARDAKVEARVESVLKKMTLRQKVGQMVELTFDAIGKKDKNGEWNVDDAKADSIFRLYNIGSILNAPGTKAPTVEQWQRHIAKIQKLSLKYMGIPCIYGLDENHGSTYVQQGTLFPQNINVAATFNRDLARKAAEATAYETRAAGIPWTYSPTVDLGRDPRWPRLWEDFGEDCYVNSEMAHAMVRGFQGDDPNHIDRFHIAACMKHYMGYGVPWTGKDRTPAYIAPNDLREKHFAPFLSGLKSGVLSVMVNSGSVNGMPVHANKQLLTTWLKEQTGWDGMLVTDWADVNNLYQREMVATDKKDALRIAINAGIDMVMEPYKCDAVVLLEQLAQEGKIPMSRIDDAVRRILRMKLRLGLFDQPVTKAKDYPLFGSEQFAQLAYQSAVESEVLLKNEHSVLPLKPGTRILLTGPNANQMRCLNGGWSYTWQGKDCEEMAERYNTIYESMCATFGKDNVVLAQGVTYNEKGRYYEENAPRYDEAVAAAKDVDVIVACVGENSYTETPGNLTDLRLSANQRTLVSRLAKTGKPIVLVLNEGRPRIVADIEKVASAVVNVLLPGNYGGDALAALLSGKENFSGKLPYTYPREINSLANYDFKKSEVTKTMSGNYDYNARITQQWPFGFGLSYTTYKYSNLRVDKTSFVHGDTISVSVDVTNSGSREGKESVLLYSSDEVASLMPDGRRLRNFSKVDLRPGETKTVTFRLAAADLAFVGYDGQWVLEQGRFTLSVGNLSVSVDCASTYQWQEPNR